VPLPKVQGRRDDLCPRPWPCPLARRRPIPAKKDQLRLRSSTSCGLVKGPFPPRPGAPGGAWLHEEGETIPSPGLQEVRGGTMSTTPPPRTSTRRWRSYGANLVEWPANVKN